jgi:hypothetical protein
LLLDGYTGNATLSQEALVNIPGLLAMNTTFEAFTSITGDWWLQNRGALSGALTLPFPQWCIEVGPVANQSFFTPYTAGQTTLTEGLCGAISEDFTVLTPAAIMFGTEAG